MRGAGAESVCIAGIQTLSLCGGAWRIVAAMMVVWIELWCGALFFRWVSVLRYAINQFIASYLRMCGSMDQ